MMVNTTLIKYLMLLTNTITDFPEYGIIAHTGVDYYEAHTTNGLNQLIKIIPNGFDRHYVLNVKIRADVKLKASTFSNLQHLEILNLLIDTSTLPGGLFSRLKSLKCLSISALLQNVDKNAFQGLGNLEQLQFSRTSVFPRYIFDKLPNLKILDLSWNHIENVNEIFQEVLLHLVILRLAGNQINALQEATFSKTPNLKKLYLNHNLIVNMSKGAFELPQLSELHLCHNNLKCINQDMFVGLRTLQYLDVRNNHISVIHAHAFANLTILDTLLLSQNDLTNLDFLTINLRHLDRLYVNQNHISELDRVVFEACPKIKILNLGKNNITSIQSGVFDDLANLTHLDLSENAITHLDRDVFSRSFSLEYLNLSNNNIRELNRIIFSENNKLKSLKLSHNKIKKLPPGIFASLDSLWYLDLNNNQLQSLATFGFLRLVNLCELNLSFNNITVINDRAFFGLKYLNKLFLNHNKLENVTLYTFAGLKYLHRLTLHNNDFVCVNQNTFKQLKMAKVVLDNRVNLHCDIDNK